MSEHFPPYWGITKRIWSRRVGDAFFGQWLKHLFPQVLPPGPWVEKPLSSAVFHCVAQASSPQAGYSGLKWSMLFWHREAGCLGKGGGALQVGHEHVLPPPSFNPIAMMWKIRNTPFSPFSFKIEIQGWLFASVSAGCRFVLWIGSIMLEKVKQALNYSSYQFFSALFINQ